MAARSSGIKRGEERPRSAQFLSEGSAIVRSWKFCAVVLRVAGFALKVGRIRGRRRPVLLARRSFAISGRVDRVRLGDRMRHTHTPRRPLGEIFIALPPRSSTFDHGR
jgi:hypothetical protein